MRCDLRISVAVAVGLALGVSLALQATSAHAQDNLPATFLSSTDPYLSKPANEYSPKNHFFVEFRARNAASYGHMYVMYGEANVRHEVIRSSDRWFHPCRGRPGLRKLQRLFLDHRPYLARAVRNWCQ